MTDIQYRTASSDDALAISILLSGAFEGPEEGQLVQSLRKTGEMALDMVAVDGLRLVAFVGFPALLEPKGWIALAPLAVRHDLQGKGIGSELVRRALDYLGQDAIPAVLVLGDPAYYERFGFSVEAAANVTSPYPSEYLGLFPIDPKTVGKEVQAVYPQAFSES